MLKAEAAAFEVAADAVALVAVEEDVPVPEAVAEAEELAEEEAAAAVKLSGFKWPQFVFSASLHTFWAAASFCPATMQLV